MTSEPLYLGIDFGTSVFKAGIYARNGILKGLGKSELVLDKCDYDAGRFELTADSFWKHVRECINAAIAGTDVQVAQIAGISYASQANSFILLGKENKTLSPLVLWPDRRGELYFDSFRHRWDTALLEKVIGFGSLFAEMAVYKFQWFQNQEPETWGEVSRIQTLSDYFVFSLTGEPVGDRGTTSLMGIWDQSANGWWTEALESFGLDEDVLSIPLRPGTFAGITTALVDGLIGLREGIPVFVGSLDHHVGAIVPLMGFGVATSVSLGTVTAAICLQNEFLPAEGVYLGPHFFEGEYYRLCFSNFGASWLKRLKDKVSPGESWDQFIQEGADSLDKLNTLAVDIEASLRNNRLVFNGVELNHSHSHYTAAVLVAIVEQINERVMKVGKGSLPSVIGICGGSTQNSIWETLLKNSVGSEIRSIPGAEFGCLGAALLAASGAENESLASLVGNIDQSTLTSKPS